MKQHKEIFCTCENQHLLAYGDTCEICNGHLDFEYQIKLTAPESHFSADYFEELDEIFESKNTLPEAA